MTHSTFNIERTIVAGCELGQQTLGVLAQDHVQRGVGAGQLGVVPDRYAGAAGQPAPGTFTSTTRMRPLPGVHLDASSARASSKNSGRRSGPPSMQA
ncbi:MAG TPA: hypothetical protein VF331_21800 [Polyangiales bacterium]